MLLSLLCVNWFVKTQHTEPEIHCLVSILHAATLLKAALQPESDPDDPMTQTITSI